MKLPKLFLALLLISSIALSFSSCKDSENVSDDPNSPENIALSKETKSARALKSFLSFTSGLDSLPDNWASNDFTIEANVGVINDEATPYVRYIPVLNKEEAITKYNSFAAQTISNDATSGSWSAENIGSLTFNVQNQPDVTATLDVNIKQLPHLTQIRFVPASAIGSNGSLEGEPYYTFGDVIKLKEGSNYSYWICARPCSKLESKTTSHWLSFQLNDVDAKSPAVPNFKKLEKRKSYDYYLPTQLGNESESLEHLQNLFKLLSIINNPQIAKLNFDITNKGFGGLQDKEFSEKKRDAISNYWDSKNIWKTVMPATHQRIDFQQELNSLAFYVFYCGHTRTPSVWMAKLSGADMRCEKKVIEWERKADGVDFRNYITRDAGAMDNPHDHVADLPQQAYIVRYKTGAELIGKSRNFFTNNSPNDEAPNESFTKKHSDIITDFYVYKKDAPIVAEGLAIMGDCIVNSKSNTMDICVQNSSDRTSNYSYFVKLWKPSMTEKEPAVPKAAALDAYSHILNVMMLYSDMYTEYKNNKNEIQQKLNYKMPVFSTDYEIGLKSMYSGISSMIRNSQYNMDIIDFQATDKDGKATSNLTNLSYFTLTFTYNENGNVRTMVLKYNVKTGKYSYQYVQDKDYSNKAHLSLYLVKDINGDLYLNEGSSLSQNISGIASRSSINTATTKFLETQAFE